MNWFDEDLYSRWYPQGYMQRFRVSRILHHAKSEIQDLIVFETPMFGRVLAIDGVIQTTERDEFIYHEMLVHVPLFTHGTPRRVLIIGGGDGGVLREVLLHRSVELARMVEIDKQVIDISRQFLPSLNGGAFEDPRTEIVIANGCDYVKECGEKFDVVLVDSTDPVGPGEVLFSEQFYRGCRGILTNSGVFAAQFGVPFTQPEELSSGRAQLDMVFGNSMIYLASIPTYVGGAMAFGFASVTKAPGLMNTEALRRRFGNSQIITRYYSPAIHQAAFALPPYIAAMTV